MFINYSPYINILLLCSSGILFSGCNSISSNYSNQPEYEFSQLDLTRNKANGETAWQIKSPEARFEKDNQLIRAKKTSLNIYSINKQKFNIKADSLTSMNNVNFVLLEGNVKLTQLNNEGTLITGDSLQWDVNQNIITIDQNPLVFSSNSSVKSNKIVFSVATSVIDFVGKTKFLITSDEIINRTKDKLVIHSVDTKWNIDTGELYSSNKVFGNRITNKKEPSFSFTGNSLRGNTNKSFLDLYQCTVTKSNTAKTIADNCRFSLYINDKTQLLDSAKQRDKVNRKLLTPKRERERIQFITIKNRVKSLLKIHTLNESVELIN